MSDSNPNMPPPEEVMADQGRQAQAAQAQLQTALQNPSIPRFYVNGTNLALTPTDMIITLAWNSTLVANLNMSYTFVKALSEDLANAVKEYETSIGQSVPSLKDVMELMSRVRGASGQSL